MLYNSWIENTEDLINSIIFEMSSNNLYDTLIEMAKAENIEFSETQSARQS